MHHTATYERVGSKFRAICTQCGPLTDWVDDRLGVLGVANHHNQTHRDRGPAPFSWSSWLGGWTATVPPKTADPPTCI